LNKLCTKRAHRAGYEVIRIPMHKGHADGSYEDFLTGFVTNEGQVWGRLVGVAMPKTEACSSQTTARGPSGTSHMSANRSGVL
jgi:hypothetical protein